MVEKKKQEAKKNDLIPEINIELIGHVDHGKTTLTQALTGKWADVHSEEKKRGITIKLGYADSTFYKCPKCGDPECYSPNEKCKECKSNCIPLRKVSFIDSPGHETLMATMLSGAAIIDAALLLVSANEPCPQPQTREHLMALEILGIKDIIVVQNKIDLVDKPALIKNYNDIKKFLKGTIAENAPVIPVSAQHNANIDVLIKTIQENFKTPERKKNEDPLFYIARSFDVNKPGVSIKNIIGGVLGGALKQGTLLNGQKVEIRPGLKKEKRGRAIWEPIQTKIAGMNIGGIDVGELSPGGSVGVLTELDPSIVKSNTLTGNVLGLPGKMPDVWEKLKLKLHLLERVVGSSEELKVEDVKIGEPLMLNVNASATLGVVNSISKGGMEINLKIPVCAFKGDRVTISRNIGSRWRLIGYSEIV
jgi:translation initiation factor 2 subunit 3